MTLTTLPIPVKRACIEDESPSGHKGANSMLYGAVARAARAMGCVDLWTYIHDDEPGTSLRAAGWIEDVEHESRGGSYDRPSRSRSAPVEGGAKVRWWAPWSASAPSSRGSARGPGSRVDCKTTETP